MSVKIRLRRMGSKKRPFYRIIATDSRNPRDGRFIETLGYYNPIVEPADINVKEDLVFKWMRCGAIPSGNAESLLRKTGTMKKWHLLQQGVSAEELESKYEELKARETPAMTTAERKQKADNKKAAEEKAVAEAKAAEEAKLAAEGKAAEDAKAAAEAEAAEAKAAEEAAAAADTADAAPADAAPDDAKPE